jgi:hypothetical protein
MPGLVFLLCAATSLGCTILLWRGYRRTAVPLLMWSALFFGFSVLDNVFLYCDMIVFPDTDLTVWRRIPSLIGAGLLLFGMVWNKS